MAKVLLHIIVRHRSSTQPGYPNQWVDDDRICSIVTCKEIADLCAPLAASASPVRIHRTGSYEQPPAVCCEAAVQAVRPRGTLFEVEFTNARALRLVPTIRPDGNESWYFAEAADVASNETAHSQTEASVHPNGDAVLSPPKTATPESSPSADRESRPVSKHLEVLQRGIEDWNFARKSKPGVKPNLQGCDLREVFAKADRFVSVQLAGADMRGANLAGLKFHQPLLCDVNLAGADLTGAIWQKAKAPIYSLDIMARYGMDLRAANLEGANLSRTTFEEPCLVGTNFRGAKLVDADFSGSMLNGICFDGADLQNAKLRGANLTNASFEGANLRGADLSTATVTKQQVAQASTDCDTKLPVDWEF